MATRIAAAPWSLHAGISLLLLALASACEQDGPRPAELSGAAATSAGGAGGTDAGVAGGGGAGGGDGGGAPDTVNGCDPASAEDHTRADATTVTSAGAIYTPSCIRIRRGASVTFLSTFDTHPLAGGTVTEEIATPEPESPIQPTSSGDQASFTFPDSGVYGYYCDFHASIGMMGAVFVE